MKFTLFLFCFEKKFFFKPISFWKLAFSLNKKQKMKIKRVRRINLMVKPKNMKPNNNNNNKLIIVYFFIKFIDLFFFHFFDRISFFFPKKKIIIKAKANPIKIIYFEPVCQHKLIFLFSFFFIWKLKLKRTWKKGR